MSRAGHTLKIGGSVVLPRGGHTLKIVTELPDCIQSTIRIRKLDYKYSPHFFKVKCIRSNCGLVSKEVCVIPAHKDHDGGKKNMRIRCKDCHSEGTVKIPEGIKFDAVIVPKQYADNADQLIFDMMIDSSFVTKNLIPVDYSLGGKWVLVADPRNSIDFDSKTPNFTNSEGLVINISNPEVEFVKNY